MTGDVAPWLNAPGFKSPVQKQSKIKKTWSINSNVKKKKHTFHLEVTELIMEIIQCGLQWRKVAPLLSGSRE